MDFGWLVFIAVLVLLIYLIFKFIKKIVYAIITVILLFFVIYFGAVGLVYIDLKNVMEEEQYVYDIIYENGVDYEFGVRIPVENGSVMIDKFSSLTDSERENLDVKEISKDDNRFVILIESDFYEGAILDTNYEFEGVEVPAQLSDLDLSLTKEEVLDLVENDGDLDDYIGFVLAKNEIEVSEVFDPRDLINNVVGGELEDGAISAREYFFLISLKQSLDSEVNVVKFIDGFKDDEIDVYPNRMSFRILKWLPTSNIKAFVSRGGNESLENGEVSEESG